MNSVIFYADEIQGSCIAVSGDRARVVSEKIGERKILTVGILGVRRATARVRICSSESVQLEVFEILPQLPRLPVHCIVGLSRPQTIKKILQAAGLFGIESLTFVASENGEKSYLQSHSLKSDAIELELISALEQACDSEFPKVEIKKSFREIDCPHHESLKILLDVCGTPFKEIPLNQSQKIIFSVGPESGWSKNEKEFFLSRGFLSASFGARVLRVETALVGALGHFAGSAF